MFFNFLIASMVSMCPADYQCPFGSVCSCNDFRSASAIINLQMTLVSSKNIYLSLQEAEPDSGIYRMAVASLETGTTESGSEEKRYLIMDNRIDGVNDKEALAFVSFTDSLEVKPMSQEVIVMEWSEPAERMALAAR